MGFDPDWKLEFIPYDGFPRWRVKTIVPMPYASIRSKSAIYPARRDEPEFVTEGEIDFATDPRNEDHKIFMRAFFSLLGKYCSNRHQIEVWTPDYTVSDPIVSTNLWLRHEAIRWALEDSRRVLGYGRLSDPGAPMLGHGVRPVEEVWRAKLG